MKVRKILNTAFGKLMLLKGRLGNNVIHQPFQVIEVPVNLITYKKGIEGIPFYKGRYYSKFFKARIAGIILDGDWDLRNDKKKIDTIYIYTGFFERYIEGREWEQTAVFEHVFKITEKKGGMKRGCKTWGEYKKRYLSRWDQLFYDMKDNGYKKQVELNRKSYDEVQVGISSKGEILFLDGIHRLCMAKVLKMKTIPVIVNIWHKKFVDRVKVYYGTDNITPEMTLELLTDK